MIISTLVHGSVAAAVTGPWAAIGMDIPSPEQAVWRLGPVPVRAYALCILAGIVLAVLIADRRWRSRGGRRGVVVDITAYAVPAGIIGARAYHVATSWQPYFGDGGRPLDALKIWQPGLGIWGAVAGGAVGAWIACRRHGHSLVRFADAAAPGIAVAQACGRWGNWFNNELYGGRTDLPWGLRVHDWDLVRGATVRDTAGSPVLLPGTYHPTFLYESLWCLMVALAVVVLDRRYRLDRGRSFALYVALYTLGRLGIETLRTDPANLILGQRLNVWTSALVFLGAVALFWGGARRSRACRQATGPKVSGRPAGQPRRRSQPSHQSDDPSERQDTPERPVR
ncbi:MAG: prolipoprotein diacylglyceryl transferase [Angustibacter sp.]